jgi:hypothetical protein
MMHPARTTRPKRCVGVKSESVTKGRGNIGIRCPPRKADWKFGETVCSNKLVDQRSSRRGAPRCWSKAPRAFLISFRRNPKSRSKLAIPCRSSVAELTWIVPPPTRSSVAKYAHRRIVHEGACRRPTPCGIDLPTINDTNGRHCFRADAVHFDALRDERTGDENRLLNHFFLLFRGSLDRRIGKRGAGRD